MARELLILRHGKSDWNVPVSDFDRPLTDRGKRGAQRIGVMLAQRGLVPDHVITSPAERAKTTAEKCMKAAGQDADRIVRDERVYAAEADQLVDVLRGSPKKAKRVMLVGHNPGVEDFLAYLVGGELPTTDDGKVLPTATLAHLSVRGDWLSATAGAAELLLLQRPASLPEKFPFPSPHGKEQRDRPAYYYTQSSVVPYRVKRGKVEILVISSSKRKHWVIPKGIHDPGKTAQQSAAKEAWEEAGVEGEVGEAPIGSYVYQKWGAACQVEVYPMQVNKLLPESKWEERHRGREWVSAEEAAQRLRQPELGPMVLKLAKDLVK